MALVTVLYKFYTPVSHYYFNFMAHIMTFEIFSCHSSYPRDIWDFFMLFKSFSWYLRTLYIIQVIPMTLEIFSCHHIVFMSFKLFSWHLRSPHVIQVILITFEICSRHSYCHHAIQVVLVTFNNPLYHSSFLMTLEISSCHSSYPSCLHDIWDFLVSFAFFSCYSRFLHDF